jgi:hypothetical protein
VAESCNRTFGHLFNLDPLGDVDLDGQCLAAFSINLRRGFAGAFLVEIGANDIGALARKNPITSSAISRKLGVIVSPRAFAAVRLMTSSNFVGCCTGSSAGLAPFRILSTYSAVCRDRSGRFAP